MSGAPQNRDRLAEITAGTHAVIDLDAYRSNLQRVAAMTGEDFAVLAVVKANAYGHGAVECAEEAVRAGCVYLGVARIDEAVQLRRGGIAAQILVIGPPNMAQIGLAIERDVALTVATRDSADAVIQAARQAGRRAIVHLKIDTGLHRYGALPELAFQLARDLDASPHVELEGVYTHFSSSDEEDPTPTKIQIERFEAAVQKLKSEGIEPRHVHLANSAAILTGQFTATTMVRAGILSYGLDPSDEVPVETSFRQILTVRSVITRRFTLDAGESVSYNRTYTAQEPEPAAAVPIGYADGIERHLSNVGWFSHKGRRCPIIGRVCMDQTVIKVPEDAREGDPVTIIGPGDDGAMTVAEVGRLCSTNTYEPVTRLAARVPRIYIRDGRPYRWAVPLHCEWGIFEED